MPGDAGARCAGGNGALCTGVFAVGGGGVACCGGGGADAPLAAGAVGG